MGRGRPNLEQREYQHRTPAEMSDYPVYFKQPIRWARYHAHNRPHIFFSVLLGVSGPILALTMTPLRRKYLYEDDEPIPLSYPLPAGGRNLSLKGYDD